MEARPLIEIKAYEGDDFKRLAEYDSWSVAVLRYSERFSRLGVIERHSLTEEVFVLLEGSAVLYAKADIKDSTESIEMEKLKVYTVPRNIWHHITVSRDASVLVIENRSTSRENTERMEIIC